jgi:hypothetical protein
MDALPTTPTGKIRKHELVAVIAAGSVPVETTVS